MSVFQTLYSEVEEQSEQILAQVSGEIPSWLKGTLIRNGPALFHVGDSQFNHWFDGFALLHQFKVDGGHVSYFNKFLRSTAYLEAMKQKRIVKTEFGTNSDLDPCKTIFSRFFSYFNVLDNSLITDNCLVNVICMKGKHYAVTETNAMIEVDIDSLAVLNKVDITKEFPGEVELFGATAHPHIASDGTVFNLSMRHGKNVSYNITSVPPKSGAESEQPLEGGTIVASIPPTSWKPSYFHSFGMTENYFIICENPFCANVFYLLARKFMGWSIADCYSWDPNMKSNFHIIDRQTGQLVTTCVTNKPTFIFHHVNAYEKDGEIVMDACCYDDTEIVYSLYLKALREDSEEIGYKGSPPQLRRYRLPLPKSPNEDIPQRQELLQGSDGLDHDVLFPDLELPQINYQMYNTKEYKYAYGLSMDWSKSFAPDKLVKIDTETKAAKIWKEDHCYPSEPIFVPCPDAKAEDEGVILSAVLNADTKNSFLLVLDAVTYEEMARADVPVLIPSNIHGAFIKT